MSEPVDIAVINPETLHSGFLGLILFGVYTPIYFGAMYLSVTSPHSRNYIAVSAITALYITSIFGTLWNALSALGSVKYNLQASMSVVAGDVVTSTSITEIPQTPDTSIGNIFVPSVEQVLSLIIADGLLVWRCYNIWNRSIRVLALCLALYIAEIALYILQFIQPGPQNEEGSERPNFLVCVAYLVTLLLTALTTFLIAYRIHSSTADIILSSSKKRFNKILEILLQSAFLYTASLVGYIVLSFVHITNFDNQTLARASFYAGAVLPVTINIGPTLMVARINFCRTENNTTTHKLTDIGFVGERGNQLALREQQTRLLTPGVTEGEGSGEIPYNTGGNEHARGHLVFN